MQNFIENELWPRLPLDGTWQFKLGEADWTEIQVPGAWELQAGDLLTEGPAHYRRSFWLDVLPVGRVLLVCDAISFAVIARLNNQPVGEHTGLWSAFQWDVTAAVCAGENVLELEVWKPGQGRYPLRETLAGFLPDVANTFGGIWQGLRLHMPGPAQPGIGALRVFAAGSGHVFVEGVVEDSAKDSLTGKVLLVDLTTQEILHAELFQIAHHSHRFGAGFQVPMAQTWSPQTPTCYGLVVQLKDVAGRIVSRVQRTIGFRDVAVRDGATMLNEVPVHIRGALSWGWNAHRLCPTPARDEVRAAFEQCRALGFNLFKLCLYVPDETLFEVADEMGMLLWLELPMWLPKVTLAFKELALREYEAILRRVHHHPSIVVVSLGCELDAEADAEFLVALRNIVQAWLPNALHCDNSGSAEAYGGAVTDASSDHAEDFYDYHFYADLHFFEPLVKHFDRPYKPNKPWIYGEFCDADTLRDFSLLDASQTWWLTQPTTFQRDELTWLREHGQRLDNAHITDDGRHLTQLARQQATAVRKFIFEHTRRRSATGGYVITGWQDTPIATSGIVDDAGALKFDPLAFQQFNADRVLVLDRERRRKWQNGGDRPAYIDPYVLAQGATAELHISLSNGASAVPNATLDWVIADASGTAVLGGQHTALHIGAGHVQELVTVPFVPITVDVPVAYILRTELAFGDERVRNTWPLWSVPACTLDWDRVIHRLDAVAVARARQGERLVLWLQHEDARLTKAMPFWREAIHVPDEVLAQRVHMPDLQHGDLRLFGVATDFALELDKVVAALKNLHADEATVCPLWRRFDARAMTWAEYVVEVQIGAGALIISTLRFGGGLGAQPATLDSNPMGAWVLRCLLG